MVLDVEALIDLLDSKLIFTTADGEFEGILKLLKIKQERAAFEHVYYRPSHKYMGTMHIRFSDMFSYKLLENSSTILDVSKLCSVGEELSNGDIEKQSRIDKSAILEDTSTFCYEQVPEHLRSSCPDDYCFIESIGSAFFRAINYIAKLNTIGVSFHGSEISSSGSLSWICIATPQCVFLFDIDSMGVAAFHRGLRAILEDKYTEKVVHDCREPADSLQHLFQTTLDRVFDTQLADYVINMQRSTDEVIFKYVSSLDSCLVKYLKVPQQLLYNRNKCMSKNAEIKFYKTRPISDELRNVLIKSTLFLLALKEKQEDLLVYPYHQAVDVYLNVVRDETEAEVFRLSHEFTQIAPRYLSECIKSVRFYDLPLPPDDTVSQFRQTLHGEEAWQKMLLNRRQKNISK